MFINQTLPYTHCALGPRSFIMLQYTLCFRTMVSHVVLTNLITFARWNQDYGLVSQALGLSKALVKHNKKPKQVLKHLLQTWIYAVVKTLLLPQLEKHDISRIIM